MLEVENIRKSFGIIEAVKGVSFSVEQGEILGFLGPNGAGKSTTMRMITGFLTPSSGTATICGHDILAQPVAAKKSFGYLPENAPVYAEMTSISFLRFCAELRGYSGAERDLCIEKAVERCRLEKVLQQPIGTLSKGFKQRVCFAQALLHDPPVLIMDEPTDGLDPNQKHLVRGMIREMSARKAIVISTHILEEVEALCTRCIIISDGRLVGNGTPDELRAESNLKGAVEIVLAQPSDSAGAELRKLASSDRVESSGERYIVYPGNPDALLADVTNLATNSDWNPTSIRKLGGRLDDVFMKLTIGDDLNKVG